MAGKIFSLVALLFCYTLGVISIITGSTFIGILQILLGCINLPGIIDI